MQLLPAQRIDAAGRARVDLRAVLALAAPLMANSAMQTVLNLTDTWFIGGQSVWIALWGILFVVPLFAVVGASGHALLSPFGLDAEVESLAAEYWFPRVAGSPFGAACWAVLGFFNGIVGTRVISLAAFYMGGVGLLLALAGPWLVPLFVGAQILWLAAAYQFFDGMNLGSGFCLRGAGDSAVPATLVLALSWFIFVPLAHTFTFAPGQGWIDGLPQLGWGLTGGWLSIVIYVMLLGTMLFVRWRSGAWKRIRVG